MKNTIYDIAITIVLTLMVICIAFALADAIFGGEAVTYWIADLLS